MSRQIQLRRGTAPDWTTSNPVLAQGEIGYETDTNKFKIGDGSSTWSALPYFTQSQSGSDLVSAINGSTGVIDDDNIASTIARDSEVSSAISTHAGNATAHHSNVNDPSTTEKAALAGTSGTPSGTNKYVTNDDSRMTDSRYPTAHAHGNITSGGFVGNQASKPLITGTAGIVQAGSFGTAAGTVCEGNDSRLSDSRTPTSHNNSAHSETYITAAGVTYEQLNTNGDVGSVSGTLCAGNDSRLSDARTPVAHAHGNITNTGYLGSTANIPLITGTAGVIQAGSFGSAASTFCQGNDSRLSDARTPLSHVHGNITNAGAIGTTADLPIKTTTGGVLVAGAFGTGATDFAAGNHTHSGYAASAHASTHVTGGSDVIANAIASGNAGLMSGADKAKLDAIEAGATADLTASEIVTLINASAYVLNDANIAATLSRTSHVHGNITASGYLGSTAALPLITGTAGIIQAGSFGSASGTFCQGNDSRLSDARTPTAHTHGNITNTGYIGSTANLPIITGTSGILQAGSFGTAANTFCVGNDARLSDARTPTSHVHGNITNAGAIGTTADLPVKTTTSGVLTVGAFGTGATDFAAGNHAHAGVYEPIISTKNSAFNVNFGTAAGTACVGNDGRLSDARTPTSHTHGSITNDGKIGSTSGLPIITTTAGALSAGSFGTTSGTFCAGDDTRLVTNAKQADRPFVFQTGHTAWATGLSNEEIGRIQLQTGETLYINRVEMQIKGGGTSASLSVNAYDSTNTTSIASQTAGGVNTTGGNSGSAALVLIRLTNSVGSTQNANVYISGWIRS